MVLENVKFTPNTNIARWKAKITEDMSVYFFLQFIDNFILL